MSLFSVVLVALLATSALADVYMHNPRGSNNHLDTDRNQQNQNRLFDSQDNAAGGYARGGILSFYEGSILTVEYTAQHSCSDANSDCSIILQYMCSSRSAPANSRIRDGTTSTQVNLNNYAETNAQGDFQVGMHEGPDFFQACQRRSRNKGLFVADQTPGESALSTRQNPGGTTHGFECAEERDYYPYWHPSPWKDIAILTSRTDLCSYYREQSQNVMTKNYCFDKSAGSAAEDAMKYNNEQDCMKNNHEWGTQSSWGIPKPECLKAPYSRDNHLGNSVQDTISGYAAHYNWTLPTSAQEPLINDDQAECVLRLRYNISTGDYVSFATDTGVATAASNGKDPKAPNVLITDDPTVTVSGEKLELAIDTSQYGRVFQDRSHVFRIRNRPAPLNSVRIFNLNVRGRRGNIVQTYPAVEYDFVPTHLVVYQADYVHYHWTGADAHNGAGEGKDKTDRSNIVQIANPGVNYPFVDTVENFETKGVSPLFESAATRKQFAFLGQTGCDEATNNEQDASNCKKLNAADATQDMGAIRMNTSGVFYYMSTRNNNFSNRSQKGTIVVLPYLSNWAIGVAVGGAALAAVGIATAFLMMYVKKNPMSRFGQWFERF